VQADVRLGESERDSRYVNYRCPCCGAIIRVYKPMEGHLKYIRCWRCPTNFTRTGDRLSSQLNIFDREGAR